MVDTAMIEDPRLLTLERGLRLMALEALVWSKLHRTDGFIPRGALPRLTDQADALDGAGELCRVGVWEVRLGGWDVVDFLRSQFSAAQVARKIQLARAARDRYEKRNPDRPRRGNVRTDGSRESSADASDVPTDRLTDKSGQVGTDGRAGDNPDSRSIIQRRPQETPARGESPDRARSPSEFELNRRVEEGSKNATGCPWLPLDEGCFRMAGIRRESISVRSMCSASSSPRTYR